MIPYKDLDALGKKARDNENRLSCEKCPVYQNCDDIRIEICSFAFESGFRRGYNQRKKEEKKKRNVV